MTIEKAGELGDAAREAYRQLFREVGRKESPEHAEVLQFVQSEYYQLHKIIIKQTTESEKRVTEPVHTIIIDTINAQSKGKSGDDKKLRDAVLNTLATSRSFQKVKAAAAPYLAQAEEEIKRDVVSERCGDVEVPWRKRKQSRNGMRLSLFSTFQISKSLRV